MKVCLPLLAVICLITQAESPIRRIDNTRNNDARYNLIPASPALKAHKRRKNLQLPPNNKFLPLPNQVQIIDYLKSEPREPIQPEIHFVQPEIHFPFLLSPPRSKARRREAPNSEVMNLDGLDHKHDTLHHHPTRKRDVLQRKRHIILKKSANQDHVGVAKGVFSAASGRKVNREASGNFGLVNRWLSGRQHDQSNVMQQVDPSNIINVHLESGGRNQVADVKESMDLVESEKKPELEGFPPLPPLNQNKALIANIKEGLNIEEFEEPTNPPRPLMELRDQSPLNLNLPVRIPADAEQVKIMISVQNQSTVIDQSEGSSEFDYYYEDCAHYTDTAEGGVPYVVCRKIPAGNSSSSRRRSLN